MEKKTFETCQHLLYGGKGISLVLFAVALIFTLAGCSDYDAGYTEKDIDYNNTFSDVFGKADPNQDWSMADNVSATVSVAGATSNATVEIYTLAPAIATSQLLASTALNGSEVKFDVVKGTEQVFAIVRQNGTTLAKGYYNITDGIVNINDTPVARKSPMETRTTRAASDVTKGAVVENFLTATETIQGETTSGWFFYENDVNNNYAWTKFGPYATFSAMWQAYLDMMTARGNTEENVLSWYSGSVVKENGVWVKNGYLDSGKFFEESNTATSTNTISINLTYLNNVEKWAADPWTLALGKQLFGPKTFFMEQEYYYGVHHTFDKKTLYGSTNEEVLSTMNRIEAGFSITTSGGEIEVPFIYGATNIQDQFGYIYYKEGQDPLAQPHYVLMSDGRPQSNLYWNSWGNSDNAVGEMQLANWNSNDEYNENEPIYGKSADARVYGTKYKLSFFGENHDQTATYTFPAGYKIVFFICPGEVNNQNADGTLNSYNKNNFNYSLPELNKRIQHYYYNYNSPTYQQGDDQTRGAVKATAWTSNGMTFMGFEDGGQDEDLNDIVFWVEGEYTANNNPPVVEVETKVTTTTNNQSWIFACEDLGGSFDYDFNDVVWEFVKEYKTVTTSTIEDGKTTLQSVTTFAGGKVRLLAAGGTLPIALYYGDTYLGNIHEKFGQTAEGGLYTPINVGTRVSAEPVEIQLPFTITQNTSVNDVYQNFRVEVIGTNGQSYYITAPNRNVNHTAPQIILLPGEWNWPREGVAITSAYPNFTNWVQNATWTNWANTWVQSLTTAR
ncbi:MAG: LruC domain-containing protein [Bacteroidaceae bacterium]|nr:LruC domain-containing protein [Bacteroidaceae bacterium]